MSATTISMTAGVSFMAPTLVSGSGGVLDGSDTFAAQLGRRHPGERAHLAREVGLVDVAGPLGDGSPREPGVGAAHRAQQAQHPAEVLRPVAEDRQQPPVQLPGAVAERVGDLTDRGPAVEEVADPRPERVDVACGGRPLAPGRKRVAPRPSR